MPAALVCCFVQDLISSPSFDIMKRNPAAAEDWTTLPATSMISDEQLRDTIAFVLVSCWFVSVGVGSYLRGHSHCFVC